MGFGGKNRVRVQASVEGVSQASGELGKFRSAFDRLAGSPGAQSVLQGVGLGAGVSAWGLLDQAISGAIGTIGDAVDKGSDLRESMSLSQQVFEGNTEAVQEWAEGAAAAFGQSTREALDFASNFGTAFKNVGMSLDETTDKAEAMTRLAADIGSAFNASSEEAAVALRSGLLGESEPLRRFGVFLDEAKVKAKAAAMGIGGLGATLTDGQKVAARYALIMEQTADSQGMFGRDTDSLADAQKSLGAEIENLQAEIGTELMPVLRDFAEWARDDGVPAVRAILDVLGELRRGFDVLGDNLGSLDARKQVPQLAEDIGLVERGLGRVNLRASAAADGIGDAGYAAAIAADKMEGLKDETRKASDVFRTLERRADEALGVLIDASPKELQLGLQRAKLEGKELGAKLRDLEQIKHPTRDTRIDILDTKLAIEENDGRIAELSDSLARLDKTRLPKHEALIRRLGEKWGWPIAQVNAYLTALDDVQKVSGGRTRGGSFALPVKVPHNVPADTHATGGYMPPGSWGTVGEEGTEAIHMLPGGGAYVTSRDQSPGFGGGGGASSAQPVVIELRLDGAAIARVVDRHLYYEAARAPQSAVAG